MRNGVRPMTCDRVARRRCFFSMWSRRQCDVSLRSDRVWAMLPTLEKRGANPRPTARQCQESVRNPSSSDPARAVHSNNRSRGGVPLVRLTRRGPARPPQNSRGKRRSVHAQREESKDSRARRVVKLSKSIIWACPRYAAGVFPISDRKGHGDTDDLRTGVCPKAGQ